ncbi:SDR family NAD(P)-dependent oxidoreductase [Paenibacillus sp. GCM10023250]|uniref:SDR family NAD(P)-dependent oxidoreductase n=1 Tax=Paenibacillus sp. GCM10023250 TaxID=3252648 RepID=UPI003605CDF0
MQRTWLITGVSSGFGRHMTEQLLKRGDRVAGTVRRLEVMDDLKAAYGDRLWLAKLDVTDTSAIREVVNEAFRWAARRLSRAVLCTMRANGESKASPNP